MSKNNFPITSQQHESSAINLVTLVYLIQAISLIIVIPFFFAMILNYTKRGEVDGTLAASHFRWQIRTFWFGLLWVAVGWIIEWGYFLAADVIVPVIGKLGHVWGIQLGLIVIGISWLWVAYRVMRGWIALADRLPAY